MTDCGSPARAWSHLNRPKLGVPNRAYLGGVLFYRCGKFQALALGICLQGSRKTRAKPRFPQLPTVKPPRRNQTPPPAGLYRATRRYLVVVVVSSIPRYAASGGRWRGA